MSAADRYHDEETLSKVFDRRLMRRLLSYMRPYKWFVVLAVLLIFCSSVVQISLAFIVKTGVDQYIEKKIAEGYLTVILSYLGAVMLILLFSYGQILTTMYLGQKVQHDLRLRIFSHLQRLHLAYFDKNPVGRLVTRVTNDVKTLDELFSTGVVAVIGDLFMLALIVNAMLYLNWQLALLTFTVLPLLFLVSFVFRSLARKAYRQVRLKLARLNAFVQEHITGMTLVQLFAQEKRTFNEFKSINADLRGAHHRSIIYFALFFPTVELLGAISLGLLLYFGGVRIMGGTMSFGDLVAFLFLVERFFAPIRDLSEKYNLLQSSMAASERIFTLLDTEPEIRQAPIPSHIEQFRGRLELDGVWFAYNDEDWVLKNLSFTVEPGQRVAVVGATGAGKTSLISLLFRFYDYQQGAIRLDGVELKALPKAELRSHLGLVLQDVFMFTGDYASNVRLRDESIADDQVRQALSRVGFDRFVDQLPDGLHTPVKERGATLSTGQKQLLSFARALAFDPDILVLDEATSSVDTETEALIQKALEKLLEGRTSIVIAHRLSTIEKADKILVLHKGELREMGKHEELIAQGGIYRTLYEMQYKKQDKASAAADLPPAQSVHS